MTGGSAVAGSPGAGSVVVKSGPPCGGDRMGWRPVDRRLMRAGRQAAQRRQVSAAAGGAAGSWASSSVVAAATSPTARSKAASVLAERVWTPLTFRTYWRAAASISSRSGDRLQPPKHGDVAAHSPKAKRLRHFLPGATSSGAISSRVPTCSQ